MLYEDYIQSLIETVQEIMEAFKFNMAEELKAQGHELTGTLANDIDIKITKQGNQIRGELFIQDYGIYIDRGVPADRIPYTIGGKRRGGTSKYIQGLIEYFKKRGLPTREAKSAAFATATVHKRQGMPTRKSYRFSKNGRRTGFIQATIDNTLPKVIELLEDKSEQAMILKIRQPIAQKLLSNG